MNRYDHSTSDHEDDGLDAALSATQDCENASLHDISSIQPFGYLLACDISTGRVTHLSENCTQCFQKPLADIFGSSLGQLFPAEIAQRCHEALTHPTITLQREYIGRLTSHCPCHDVFAYQRNDALIIELQRASSSGETNIRMLDNTHRALEKLSRCESVEKLLDQAVTYLRRLTGFDRVKAYRFLSNGEGEVVAESREPEVESFLGLRFPSYDVPKAARALYASVPIRMIPSVRAAPVDILAHDSEKDASEQERSEQERSEQEPLDLSLSVLRAVAPVHMTYLQNMGVSASLSLPIVIDGELWGLFALHHMSEKAVPDTSVLLATELLGGALSVVLKSLLQHRRLSRLEQCTHIAKRMFLPDKNSLGFSSQWHTVSQELMTLLACDGLALMCHDHIQTFGAVPSDHSILALASALERDYQHQGADRDLRTGPPIVTIDALSVAFPDIEFGQLAGVMVLPGTAPLYQYLYFFRNAVSENIHWAGVPDKNLEKIDGGFRLNPRASFDKYIDEMHARSDAFDDDDVAVCDALRDAFSLVISSIAINRQQHDRLDLTVKELNLRVRNMLALVRSLVSPTGDPEHELQAFILALEYRVQALAETHKLLAEYDWQPIRARVLMANALGSYSSYINSSILLDGDDLVLPPILASALTLVIYELVSNAAKFGALSEPQGMVTLRWYVDHENLIVQWQESEGPKVEAPTQLGFGVPLIRKALAYEFDAECELYFYPSGVEASFTLPHSNTHIKREPIGGDDTTQALDTAAAFTCLLVLDDRSKEEKDLRRVLRKLGAVHIDIVGSTEQASTSVRSAHYDFALLDIALSAEAMDNLLALLEEEQTPAVLLSGSRVTSEELIQSGHAKVLQKPINEAQLMTVLRFAGVCD